MNIIELKNINKSSGQRIIFKNLNLKIESGDMVAMIGRSGCGKTTLLNMISFLEDIDNGTYLFEEEFVKAKDISIKLRDDIGIIVQDYALLEEKNAYYNIALPLLCKKCDKKFIKSEVNAIAEKLKIDFLLKQNVKKLSGGERQRVAIARALVKKPKIIIADEPTGALDLSSEKDVMNLLKQINKLGITVIIATHSMEIANMCNKILKIYDYNIEQIK